MKLLLDVLKVVNLFLTAILMTGAIALGLLAGQVLGSLGDEPTSVVPTCEYPYENC